jgi:hypothetical protein
MGVLSAFFGGAPQANFARPRGGFESRGERFIDGFSAMLRA